uniref:Reverse transcriptase domain-containing protein n=1 Tax=Tanacetum cinerariifolium TaxID=118510 RepID=A0A6L2KCM2_TANCI|nr:hypothetical protein [Tanacetum cinerariifolium]
MPSPEDPPSFVYVPYVSEPAYPKFMPLEDQVFLAEEQPLPAAVSTTADSPGYITESDLEEYPKEEDDEDPEEDPADYPADRVDDDEEEEDSSKDDVDDKEEDEGEDEEEEHLAPADSVPPPIYRTTARMFVRAQTHIPFPSEAEVDRLLAIPTPPSSPLTPLSSLLPWIPSPPFPVPSPLPTSPIDARVPVGYKAAMIRLRAESPSTSHALLLPPPIVLPHVLEVALPPRKRLYITLGPRFKVEKCSYAPTARPTGGFRADYGFVGTLDAEIRRDPDIEIGYGITDVWDDPDENADEIPVTDLAGLGQRMIDFVTTVRHDTYEIYRRLDDAYDDRLLMSGRLNLLRKDRRSYASMARLMKTEARASREAWVQSTDASDTTRSKVRALQTMILAHQTEIKDLRAADHRRQAQLTEALTLLKTLQTQMVALQSQQRPARDLAHPDKMAPTKRTTRASPATTTTTTLVTNDQLKALIDQGVVNALAARDADRSRNGNDNHNLGTGSRRTERTVREYTYTDFLKCQPMNFKGTEGVVGLTQWFERMETVFNKSHVKTVGQDAAHDMPWNTLMKMMTAKYCSRNEIKKLEMQIWELKVKGIDLTSYTQCFQELALMCGRMFPEESDKI